MPLKISEGWGWEAMNGNNLMKFSLRVRVSAVQNQHECWKFLNTKYTKILRKENYFRFILKSDWDSDMIPLF